MIDRTHFLTLLDRERRELGRDGEMVETLDYVTRLRETDGAWHTVAWSLLDESSADAAIADQIEHHRRLGVNFEWKLYGHDHPPGLLTRLERHGFAIGPREAVLVCDLTDRPQWIDSTDRHTVIRVERLEQVEVFRTVAGEIFEKDYHVTARHLAAALQSASKQHHGYLAYADGQPAGVGRLHTHPLSRFGGLYGGGVGRAFRGRGLYRALVAARARDALADGIPYLIVDALPTSRPILERLGFTWLTDTWPCEWRAG